MPLPRTTRWPAALQAPSTGGDGATSVTPEPTAAQKAALLVDESTGLRFEHLVLFAEPLFEQYDLDPEAAFALRTDIERADEATVTALEAARILWAFLSLPPDERRQRHRELADYLLGPHHEPEDEYDLEVLLERMEVQWDVLSETDRRLAESTDARTLDFGSLLAHPGFRHDAAPPSDHEVYGPQRLSALEAQAVFGQPLINEAEDPDAMEEALERTQAYWELAHLTAAEREARLRRVVSDFADDAATGEQIEREARRMLQRFDELFPEHAA